MRLGRLALVGTVLLAGRASAGEESVPRTPQEKRSYGMGVAMAQSLKRQEVEVDVDLVVRGLRDGLSGRKLFLTDDELRQAASAFQAELKQAQAARMAQAPPAAAAAEARKQGEAFLAANAKNEGVVTLRSGLQYKVLQAGDGKKPTDADRVVCHYRGTLVDGSEFDSSLRRGRPATIDLARAIPGWREALKMMPVGSKWRIFIPPQLAYGERGRRGKKRSPGKIGPNATLIFEVELLAIQAGPHGSRTAAAAKPPAAPGN